MQYSNNSIYSPYQSPSQPFYATRPAVPSGVQLGLKGRPVTSLEEVRGLSIDFDGSVFFFPDIANKRIYTKQINMDGTCSINTYELVPTPISTDCGNYVTRQEFDATLAQLRQMLTPAAVESKPIDIAQQF